MAYRFPIIALAAIPLLAACGSDDGTAAANLSWQFQCETPFNCAPALFREVVSFDGERGNRVSCSGIDVGLGNVRLEFSAENPAGDFGVSVENVTVSRESLAITAAVGCSTTVVEGNAFIGDCGALEPSPMQPCQLRFEAVGGGNITGFVRCHGIPLGVNNRSRGRLLADGVTFDPEGTLQTQGVSFAFSNCDGV